MSKPPFLFPGLIAAWLAASLLGFLALGFHAARPSSPGSPPDQWPSATLLPLSESLPTLLIFIHPRCPCSRASLAELEGLSARFPGRFAARAIVYRPDRAGQDWDRPADLGRLAKSVDLGGREAARFGVETSGHVLLFDPSGRRLFSGGITISRGHRGENPGLDRLAKALSGSTPSATVPVFGCPFLAPAGGVSRSRPS